MATKIAATSWRLGALIVALVSPAQAQQCTPDTTASLKHFKTAYDAIFYHQGLAWACSAYIGDDLARSGVVHIEGMLTDSGWGHDEAAVKADEVNMDAKAQAAREVGLAEKLQAMRATKQEAMIACSQLMSEESQKFSLALAKMRLALCK